ncbi:hypothetical protein ACFQ3N_08705 [Virgibacillus byunsanensis]|uniref:Type II secretion system protein n=1 Tax=Virgibacillus byunsanensis TaxID=570945 RepID=A0ABW3LJA1_9BACI
MLNNNGFSLIESLVANSIMMMIILTIVPIISLLNSESVALSNQREFVLFLHDELQPYIHNSNESLPSSYTVKLNSSLVTFSFSSENEFIKGCAEWNNVKNQTKKHCIYGYSQN